MQIESLTMEDRTSPTPVELTVVPQQINGGLASFLDTSGGVSLGFPRFTASLTRPGKNSKYSRVRLRLVVPVLEPVVNVGEAPKLAYENLADITFTLHERSTLVQRTQMYEWFASLFVDGNNASIDAMVKDLEMLY